MPLIDWLRGFTRPSISEREELQLRLQAIHRLEQRRDEHRRAENRAIVATRWDRFVAWLDGEIARDRR